MWQANAYRRMKKVFFVAILSKKNNLYASGHAGLLTEAVQVVSIFHSSKY